MYNSDIKEKFIADMDCRDLSSYKNTIQQIFKTSEDMEIVKGKDLAEFDHAEFIQFFKKLRMKTVATARRRIWLMNKYISWYSEKINWRIVAPTYTTNEIKSILVEKYSWSYLRPNRVEDICLNLLPSTTGFLLYAVYIGAGGPSLEEVTSIKLSDLDEKNLKLALYIYDDEGNRIHSRDIAIDNIFIFLAQKADQEKCYYDDSGRKLGYLESSPYILKRREGSVENNLNELIKSKYKMCRDKIIAANKKAGIKKISVATFRYSGIINYLKELIRLLDINIVFKKEELLKKENQILIESAAKKYNVNTTTIKRVINEYFEII